MEIMEIQDAVGLLSDGHGVLTLESASAICETFRVSEYPSDLIMRWQGQDDAYVHYGFMPYYDAPGSGVDTLDLSYHVAYELGLGAPGRRYTGRGFQAQANARAVATHFAAQSK